MTIRKQKILAIDDEPRNLNIIAETIEDTAELKLCPNGEEALAAIETFLPDLVLLDIMMPGVDGYQVCQKIRANPKLSFVKVILVSGKAMIDERLKGYVAGADDYMTKPFVPEELLAKAKVFLRLTKTEKELADLNENLDRKVQEKTKQLIDTEGKLITAAKMAALGEMAGGIAHEINTPLGTIALVADQLSEMVLENTDPQLLAKQLEIILKTVKKISIIIQGLRTFSRDGSKDTLETAPLKEIIENTLSLCAEKFKHASIKVQLDPIPDDMTIQCRPVQISQVLINLLNNSHDAILSREQKWIKISVERKNDSVQISVTDSGEGISEKVRNKIFQPFFTTKDIGKGTGLGLSISKGIVESHNGQLSIDADCKNTRFVLSLRPGASAKSSPTKVA
jgi:C4-dicarboxylate-specific signal transduction histidine kinase